MEGDRGQRTADSKTDNRLLLHSRTLCPMIARSILVAVLFVFGVAVPAVAQSEGACEEWFPEAEWVQLDASVHVYAAGVPAGHAERYAGEIDGAVAHIEEHFGPFEATVCLFDPKSGFDQSRFVSGSDRLHAMLLPEDDLLLLSTENIGLTGSAAAFGLAHLAIWQYSDGTGYPEPQASTIAQYFRSEVRGRGIYDHAEAKAANFFGPDVVTPWSAGTQANPLMWDPSRGRTGGFGSGYDPVAAASAASSTHMADLVRFGFSEEGEGFITNQDPAMWTDLEARWRTALTVELMGSEEPTRTWMGGLAIAIGILVVAAMAIALGLISKLRGRGRPETGEPIPGFFESMKTPAD